MAESADDTRSADGRHGPKAPAIRGEKLLSVEDRMKAHGDDLARMLKPAGLWAAGATARGPVGIHAPDEHAMDMNQWSGKGYRL